MSGTHAQTVPFVRETMLPEQAPPVTAVGIIGWGRDEPVHGLVQLHRDAGIAVSDLHDPCCDHPLDLRAHLAGHLAERMPRDTGRDRQRRRTRHQRRLLGRHPGPVAAADVRLLSPVSDRARRQHWRSPRWKRCLAGLFPTDPDVCLVGGGAGAGAVRTSAAQASVLYRDLSVPDALAAVGRHDLVAAFRAGRFRDRCTCVQVRL